MLTINDWETVSGWYLEVIVPSIHGLGKLQAEAKVRKVVTTYVVGAGHYQQVYLHFPNYKQADKWYSAHEVEVIMIVDSVLRKEAMHEIVAHIPIHDKEG